MFKKSILIISALILAGNCWADTSEVRRVLMAINQVYEAAHSSRTVIQYHVYQSEKDKVPIETMKYEVIAGKDFSLTLFKGKELFVKKQWKIVADHDEKYLFLEKYKDTIRHYGGFSNLDTIFKEAAYAKIVKETGSSHVCIFGGWSTGEFQKVEIKYDPQTKLLKSLRFFHNKMEVDGMTLQPVIEILILNQEMNIKLNEEDYTIGKYVVKKENRYVVQPKYKEYELVVNPEVEKEENNIQKEKKK